jgi:FkbM family methyltransferase
MAGLLKPFAYEPAKHLYKLVARPEYRNLALLEARLRRVPRYTECQATVHNWHLKIPDAASFLFSYDEIFVKRIYDFPAATTSPKILDLGANVGLSVLFFKWLYPQAQIVAFEADPKIYQYLTHNVHGNNYRDVELINAAAWDENTELAFTTEGADGGHIQQAAHAPVSVIRVPAINMAEHLQSHSYDFVKMDIEGAEERVLPACLPYLDKTTFLFVEYHSHADRKQWLPELMSLLAKAGFRIHLHSVVCSASPFAKRVINAGFDLQLNVFAWRET